MAWGKCKKRDEPLVYSSLDELLVLLAEERQKTLKSRRIAKIFLAIYLSLFILVLIVALATRLHGVGGFFNAFGSFGGVIGGMYAATQKQKKGVQALAEFDDIRAVPRLIEMLEYNDQALRNDAANLLQTLLPKLRASDAAILSPEHHAILNRLLTGKLFLNRRGKKPLQMMVEPLQITTLRALQQVGDASSLPIVTELAEDGRRKTHVDVAEAAKECLPFLQMRAENQRQTQTLLRASDGNQTATDVLLRPAMADVPNTPADQLLRAASEHDFAPSEPAVQTTPREAVVQTPFAARTLPTEDNAEAQAVPLRAS